MQRTSSLSQQQLNSLNDDSNNLNDTVKSLDVSVRSGFSAATTSSNSRGNNIKNPPDFTSVALAKIFTRTFLELLPENLQDEAWAIGANEVRRLFVLAPRVMLFAHRPLCSLCHPHLSTIAWRSDLATKLKNDQVAEDLISWKLNAAIAQAQHLAQLAMRRTNIKGREATAAAYHGSIVPPEASQAALQTKRFHSLMEALENDVVDFIEEIKSKLNPFHGIRQITTSKRNKDDNDDDQAEENEKEDSSSAENSLNSSSSSDDDDSESDGDNAPQSPQALVLTKNIESGVYFARPKNNDLDPEEREAKRRLQQQEKEQKRILKKLLKEEEQRRRKETRRAKKKDPLLHYQQRQQGYKSISLSEKWVFFAELHAHIRMSTDKVSFLSPEEAEDPSPPSQIFLNSLLGPGGGINTNFNQKSSAKMESIKCVERWRTNPQIMGMLRAMFKRLATTSNDPRFISRTTTALKRAMSMNFSTSSTPGRNNQNHHSNEENSNSNHQNDTRATLNVKNAITPNDFDAEGGHLRRRLSRVFSSFRSEDGGGDHSATAKQEEALVVEQSYVSVSSFVLFQQRLFSCLYHATADEQVICAALLDFIIDSEYIGKIASSTSSGVATGGSFAGAHNIISAAPALSRQGSMMMINDEESDDDDDNMLTGTSDRLQSEIGEEETKRRQARFMLGKKELSSFTRLSSSASGKKLADEMAVAAEQRERERVISLANTNRTKVSVAEKKEKMKDRVIAVAKQFGDYFFEKSNTNNIFKLTDPLEQQQLHQQYNVLEQGNNFSDDLLFKAEQTAAKLAPASSNRKGGSPLLSSANYLSLASTPSTTTTTSIQTGGAKGLLQVRDFARFGVFFEGFCKFMFELCDNWAASHSIDGVAAFLGFLCRVAFPHPIDTIWARNLPQHIKNELKEKQKQKEREAREKEKLLSQEPNLDTAFDVQEQQAADDAAAALLEEQEIGKGGKNKKKRDEGEILQSIIDASKKSARRGVIGRNKAKDAKKGKKGDGDSQNDSLGVMPQIVIHAPDLDDGKNKNNKDQGSSSSVSDGEKKKERKKKVTFRFDVVDDYASDDEDKFFEDSVTDEPVKKELKGSKRYSNKDQKQRTDDEENNVDEEKADNDEEEDEENRQRRDSEEAQKNILSLLQEPDKIKSSEENESVSDPTSTNESDSPLKRLLRRGDKNFSEDDLNFDDSNSNTLHVNENSNDNVDINNNKSSKPNIQDQSWDSLKNLSSNDGDFDEKKGIKYKGHMLSFMTTTDRDSGSLNNSEVLPHAATTEAMISPIDKALNPNVDAEDDDAILNAFLRHHHYLSTTKRTEAAKDRQKTYVHERDRTNPIQEDRDALIRHIQNKTNRQQQIQLILTMMKKRRNEQREAVARRKQLHREEEEEVSENQIDDDFDKMLLQVLTATRDPVLERYSHVLSKMAPPTNFRDKEGNLVGKEGLKAIAVRTVKPFEERRYLYDIWLEQQLHAELIKSLSDPTSQPQKTHHQSISSSSRPSSAAVSVLSSSSLIKQQQQRPLLPMVATTFETHPQRQKIVQSMVIGGVTQKLNPRRPESSQSSSSRFSRKSRMNFSNVKEKEEPEKTEPVLKLEVVMDK